MDPIGKFREDVARIIPKGMEKFLERPPENIEADLALPCFAMSGKKKSPVEIAGELASGIKPRGLVKEVRAVGPYVNFYLDWDRFGGLVLEDILKAGERYGSGKKGEKMLLEHTGANPDGPLHLGHFRNTILGDSLVRILRFSGNSVKTIAWVNDTGRQIAIAVMEYRKKREKPGKKGDWWVLDLYIKGNKNLEKKKELDGEIKKIISDFESGDRELARDFHIITDQCIRGQRETLSGLGVKVDEFFRESQSLADGSVKRILDRVRKIPGGKEDGKRIFVDLKKFGIEREFTLTREDGTTIYPARDLAFHAHKFSRAGRNVNIIGTDQKFYFRQLISTLGMLFPKQAEKYRVVFYEFLLLPEGSMSTRSGKFVSVDELLEKAGKVAEKTVHDKMPHYGKREKGEIARMVSVGALKYAMVKVSPEKTYAFKVEDALSFEGDTGPYLQYTYARASSILRKGKVKALPKYRASLLEKEKERALMKKLAEFPGTVEKASADLRPHYIANYAYSLADLFNNYYQSVPVLRVTEDLRNARLALVSAVKAVLKNALGLLGIEAPERM